MIAVIASGAGDETERTCTIVRNHVWDGPIDPKAPTRVVPEDGKAPPAPFALCWKSEEKANMGVLQLFDPAALICLVKKGYRANTMNGMTLGFGPSGMAELIFLAPTTNGQSVRLNVVSSMPGQEAGEKATANTLAQLVKILYE
jgi:hypothetical protein